MPGLADLYQRGVWENVEAWAFLDSRAPLSDSEYDDLKEANDRTLGNYVNETVPAIRALARQHGFDAELVYWGIKEKAEQQRRARDR